MTASSVPSRPIQDRSKMYCSGTGIFCAPTALPPALADQRFLQVVIDDGGRLCAIREDHSVVCDALGAGPKPEAPAGQFKQMVMLVGAICGIRMDGSIGCFGLNAPVPPADW